MSTFTPRNSPPEAWLAWLADALGLQRRAPWYGAIAACVLLLAAWGLTHARSALLPLLVALTCAPPVLALFVIIAARADGRTLGFPNRQAALARALSRLAALGVLSWLVFLLFFAIAAALVEIAPFLYGSGEIPAIVLPSLLSGRHGLWYLAVGSLLFLAGPILVYLCRGFCFAAAGWFLVPLLLHQRLTLRDTYALAQQAETVNRSAVVRVRTVCVILAGAVAFSGGVLGVLALPLIGALQYVSYRDVFLGRTGSNPAAVSPGRAIAEAVPPVQGWRRSMTASAASWVPTAVVPDTRSAVSTPSSMAPLTAASTAAAAASSASEWRSRSAALRIIP